MGSYNWNFTEMSKKREDVSLRQNVIEGILDMEPKHHLAGLFLFFLKIVLLT